MKGKKLLTLLLSVIVILTFLLPSFSVGAESATTEYDYSKEGSYFNTTFTSSDVLALLGVDLTDGERAYLDAYGKVNISYEQPTTQQISVVTSDGGTTVVARPYGYVSSLGNEALWTPTTVSVDGIDGSFVFADGAYVADFGDITLTDDSSVSVNYTLNVTFLVSADDVNELLNLAYSNAPAIKANVEQVREEYVAKKNYYDLFYEQNTEAVDTYYSDLAFYEQYLIDKRLYDERNLAYLEYLSEYAEYEAKLKLYNDYLADLDEYNAVIDNNLNYEDNLVKYGEDLVKYEEYLSKISVVREQIEVLDSGLFAKVSHLKRDLHASIFAGLVDKVVANKELFVTVLGVDEQIIVDCADATDDIRSILAPPRGVAYKDLDSEQDKYDFYMSNHAKLRDGIVKLTRALFEIYSYDFIRNTMHNPPKIPGETSEDYTERFAIFISQLIYFSNALSDETVMDYTGSFKLDGDVKIIYWDADGNEHNKKVIDILEGNEFVKDSGNAEPISGGYPSEVAEPIMPTLLPVPEYPTPVSRPIEPTSVDHPGDEPDALSSPTPPEGFIDLPTPPEILDNEAYALLIADYDGGLLSEREEVSEDIYYTPTLTLTKTLGGTDTVSVVFTDGYGEVLFELSVDKGTSANFMGALPIRAEDVSASYAFSCWVDSSGAPFDLSSVGEDVVLYPSFTPSYKEYDVLYNVNGTGVNYVDVAVPDEELEYLPLGYFTDLASKHSAGIIVTASNLTLELRYSDLLALRDAGCDHISVYVDTSTQGAYYCALSAKNSVGASVDTSVSPVVSLQCDDASFAANSLLTFTDGDEVKYANKSYSNGKIRFGAIMNKDYSIVVRYTINLPTSLKDKVTSPSDAIPGSTVEITVDTPPGSEAEVYYFLDSDPTVKHTVDGFSFVMPSGNVNLRVRFTEILYTVIFVNDGKEISVATYKYGETVRVPNDPIKLNDGSYSYDFVGWSPELSAVTSDVTYVAEYERTPLPVVKEKFPWISVAYYSFISLACIGIVTLVIFILNKKGIISVKGIISAIGANLSRVVGKIKKKFAKNDASSDHGEGNNNA